MRKLLLASVLAIAAHSAHAATVETVLACGDKDIALYKWDVVALETDPANLNDTPPAHHLVEGSCAHLVKHDDAWWAFSTREHADLFEANPAAYTDQLAFGGLCAMGIAGYGPKGVPPHATAAPEVFAWRNGRFYFQTDLSKLTLWLKDPDANIKRADENWKAGDFVVRTSDSFRPAHPDE
jgi:hypothetical protein